MDLTGWLLVPEGETSTRLERGRISIEDGVIAALDLDASADGDRIIMPGFVDSHLHLPQFDSIGADGLELLDWLQRVVFPAELRWEDASYARSMTERVLEQCASFGTTSFAAYATVHHASAAAAIDAIASAGHRAIVGQVLMDRGAPDGLVRPSAQLLDEAARLSGSGRVEVSVTPRFAVSCTPELLEGAGRLAGETGWAVQTHLAETEPECRLIGELFDGVPYAEVYAAAGLLGARSLLAHGIWLGESELELIRGAGAVVAHCPTANLFLRAGAMNRAGWHGAGVRTSLGSDVAGGPDRSMVRVGRAMIETAKLRGGPAPDAAEAWWQITAGNAAALGWGSCGRLEAGCEADLVVIEPDIRWRETPDPLGALLYAWDDRWVRATVVAGRVPYGAVGAT